jgi:hypothetical protein
MANSTERCIGDAVLRGPRCRKILSKQNQIRVNILEVQRSETGLNSWSSLFRFYMYTLLKHNKFEFHFPLFLAVSAAAALVLLCWKAARILARMIALTSSKCDIFNSEFANFPLYMQNDYSDKGLSVENRRCHRHASRIQRTR